MISDFPPRHLITALTAIVCILGNGDGITPSHTTLDTSIALTNQLDPTCTGCALSFAFVDNPAQTGVPNVTAEQVGTGGEGSCEFNQSDDCVECTQCSPAGKSVKITNKDDVDYWVGPFDSSSAGRTRVPANGSATVSVGAGWGTVACGENDNVFTLWDASSGGNRVGWIAAVCADCVVI